MKQDTPPRFVAPFQGEPRADRATDEGAGAAEDPFALVDAGPLVAELEKIRDAGGSVSDAVRAAREFGRELERARAAIERRFGYHERLAAVGTAAHMIIHEIRNRTSVIGRGLRMVSEQDGRSGGQAVGRAVAMARESVVALEVLADRFAPLAGRRFRSGRCASVVEESVDRCLEMLKPEIDAARIAVLPLSDGRTVVTVDPGEIDAVILNLLKNAVYWLRRCGERRELGFRMAEDAVAGRVELSVDDSGPGIESRDSARVFRAGVTGRPDGIGMGLAVAAEIVAGHGGEMRSRSPGALGGATIEFDLPLATGGDAPRKR